MGSRKDVRIPSGVALCVLRGFYEGLELLVDREWIVVGRGRSADYAIADPTLSRAHAAFGFDEHGCFVEDLESTNGTLVNGERQRRAPLEDGDHIQMGRLELRIRLPDAGEA